MFKIYSIISFRSYVKNLFLNNSNYFQRKRIKFPFGKLLLAGILLFSTTHIYPPIFIFYKKIILIRFNGIIVWTYNWRFRHRSNYVSLTKLTTGQLSRYVLLNDRSVSDQALSSRQIRRVIRCWHYIPP